MTRSRQLSSEATPRLGPAAWGAVLRVHAKVVPVLDRELHDETGLPLTWYDVLLELNSAPERRLRMTDLGERVVLSRTRISRLVDEMALAGLVGKQPNPTDRRSAYATISEAGRARLRKAAPVYLRGIEEHFSRHLTAMELATLIAALEKVHAAGS